MAFSGIHIYIKKQVWHGPFREGETDRGNRWTSGREERGGIEKEERGIERRKGIKY